MRVEATGYDEKGQLVGSDEQWLNLRWPDSGSNRPSSPVMVSLTGHESNLPSRQEMAGWLRSEGKSLRLAPGRDPFPDPGSPEVVVVLDPLAPPWFGHLLELFPEKYFELAGGRWPELERLEPELRLSLVGEKTSFVADLQRWLRSEPATAEKVLATLPDFWQQLHRLSGLPEGTRVRWVSPRAAGDSSTAVERSVSTQVHGADGLGLLRLARTARSKDFPLRFADAVAALGMELAATARPRALILLRAGSPDGGSRLRAPAVYRYLRALGVPLLVWDLRPNLPRDGWPEPRRVGFALPPPGEGVSYSRAAPAYFELTRATRELNALLETQRVVWLEGKVPPGSVELATEARGFELLSDAIATERFREEPR